MNRLFIGSLLATVAACSVSPTPQADTAQTSTTATTTTTGSTTTGTTSTTATGPADLANCSVVQTVSYSPEVQTTTYNVDGLTGTIDIDDDGDGSIDSTITYVWTLNATGTPIEHSRTSTEGWSAYMLYDEHGWPIETYSDQYPPPLLITFDNTYEAGVITQTVTTIPDIGVTTSQYDQCEHVVEYVSTSIGYPNDTSTSWFEWTYSSGCLPVRMTMTSSEDPSVVTTTFDLLGRIVHQESSGAFPFAADWEWTCP